MFVSAGQLFFIGLAIVYSLINWKNGVLAATADPAIIPALITAASQVDRINILQNDSDFVFDFLNPPPFVTPVTGAGGHTIAATRKTFPALVSNGMAMTIGFLGPCGLNTPHTHPRATEFNFIVNGTVMVGFQAENGARFVFNNVTAGQATIFPKGSIHFEQNLGCDAIIFVAAFNDEDPGVNQAAQGLFALPPDVVSTTLGGINVANVRNIKRRIPANVALGTEECRRRCGLQGYGTETMMTALPKRQQKMGLRN